MAAIEYPRRMFLHQALRFECDLQGFEPLAVVAVTLELVTALLISISSSEEEGIVDVAVWDRKGDVR